MSIDPKKFRPAFLRDKFDAEGPLSSGPRVCRMCPTKLKGHTRYYCSGMCMNAAKLDGTYGKEEAL